MDLSVELENYFDDLSVINERWTGWLSSFEQRIVSGTFLPFARQTEDTVAERPRIDQQSIDDSEGTRLAEEILQEVSAVLERREQLLEQALAAGLPRDNLSQLARSLPQWKDRRLREKLALAQSQLRHLRRLHFSAWVLLHQCMQHYSQIARFVTHGESKSPVYNESRHCDRQGGRVLNANI
ncbi:MAG TPA: hypothetical protein DDW52_15875 [Planctomycetaceae bacterium]|nr:hypothetical protein [Planctomycetaceae bacterium]